MTVSKAILVALFFTLSQQALGLEMCFYARADGSPFGGHSFVTVEKGSKSNRRVLRTFGLWPREKYAAGMAINKGGDHPKWWAYKHGWELSPKLERMTEKGVCADTGRYDLEEITELAQSYVSLHGRWNLVDNNCTHFAIRMFVEVTGALFSEVQSPNKAINLLKRAGY